MKHSVCLQCQCLPFVFVQELFDQGEQLLAEQLRYQHAAAKVQELQAELAAAAVAPQAQVQLFWQYS